MHACSVNASMLCVCSVNAYFAKGILPEAEESVRLTSSYFLYRYFFHFYETSYLNKEVKCIGPSPSVRAPCFVTPLLYSGQLFVALVTELKK
jgi:hypothetical protein